jgi:hypothetical protein
VDAVLGDVEQTPTVGCPFVVTQIMTHETAALLGLVFQKKGENMKTIWRRFGTASEGLPEFSQKQNKNKR